MISHGFKRLFSLLLFAFGFWSVQVSTAQEINYKLVPNLQQMKTVLLPRILLFLKGAL